MRPNKIIGLCLALGVVGALAGPAHSGGKRVESGDYTGGGVEGVVGLSGSGQADVGAVRFDGGPERYVSAEVVDATGRRVAAEVVQLGDPDQPPLVAKAFCGKTARPVKIRPGIPVQVYVYFGEGCGGEPVSAPTTGTITAVFTG